MRLRCAIVFGFCMLNTMAYCQDTVHMVTIKVKRSRNALKSLDSYSNTLYTGVINEVQINYPDSMTDCYTIDASMAYTEHIGHGRFRIVKYKPGTLTVSIYRKELNGNAEMIGAQDFDVKPLPDGVLTIAGNVIDSTASLNDMIKYRTLGIIFGDFTPLDSMCTVKSFDMSIDSVHYHSTSSELTDDMLTALEKTKQKVLFRHVQVVINSKDEVEYKVSDDKKERVAKQREYFLPGTDKPVLLQK